MADYDLVVRGGTVAATGGITMCDVGIKDGRIAALGRGLSAGSDEVDAEGLLVLPGGIDPHCHIDEPPVGEVRSADSFASATTAAACGGTTSVICFAKQPKGGHIAEPFADYAAKAESAVIDYGFHLVVTDPRPEILEKEFAPLIARGHRSLKLFMTYDPLFLTDGQVLDILAFARRHRSFVVVHAENHDAIKWLTRKLEEHGLTGPLQHAWSKPMPVEREATHRAIMLAELLDVPVQIFHVSGAEAADEIRRAQARGVKVFGETCPQYLVLEASDLDREGFEGAKYVFSPAPRTKADQEALWRALREGVLDVVSSDHCPFDYEGPHGKQAAGKDAPFARIPNGTPGIETRLPLLFSEGVSKGRIDLETFVRLSATNAAKTFGLYPRKGAIAVGADADIAIWDPAQEATITNAALHHGPDYTPYEGMKVKGWPVVTIARGDILWRDGEVSAKPGRGRMLLRDPYDRMTPRGHLPTPFDPVTGELR